MEWNSKDTEGVSRDKYPHHSANWDTQPCNDSFTEQARHSWGAVSVHAWVASL